ncbi:MAG: ABC transporter permease [Deltaproteobacteria bacterium]|nr:ABC transporter permease [Deltaproteobacteria bacterium]
MPSFIIKRLATLVPVLLGVSVAAFLSLALCPGDAAEIALRSMTEADTASPEALLQVRKELGLDEPLTVQYGLWLGRTLQGDLGRSFQTGRPVSAEILRALGPSAILAGSSMLLTLCIVLPLGSLAAAKPGSWVDRAAMGASLLIVSLPDFCVGVILFLVFAVHWNLLPVAGYGTPGNLVLPAVTLAVASSSISTRLMRTLMVQALEEKFVITARSKGMTETRVVGLHAMRNALPPVLNYLGGQLGYLFGGAVVVESIFLWPGLGRLLVDAVKARDMFVVQGCVLTIAAIYVSINLIMDLLQIILDPRQIEAGGHV